MLITIGDLTLGEESHDLFFNEVVLDIGELRTEDVERPLQHGSRPGAEYLAAGFIDMVIVTSPHIVTESEADEVTGRFLGAWRKGLQAPPGEMIPLLIQVNERERIVYGRPGRVTPPTPGSVNMNSGISEIIAEFRILDPLVYGADPDTTTISVVPKSLGGIVAPIVTPVTTTLTSDTSYRFVENAGQAPSPMRALFHGPARDPMIEVDGFMVGVVGNIAYDETVVIDGRTRTIELENGPPISHRLMPKSRLDKLTISPGTHEVSFTATDRTGTAYVTIETPPTYYHI